MKRSFIKLGLAGAVFALASAVAPLAQAQTITAAGATFPYPIYSKWFQAYHQTNPGVTINYQAVGSGAGIAQYKAGLTDFGATDAPLSDSEIASMPQPTLHIPTVAGAVVLVYNIPAIGPGLRLSGDVIGDIYLGKIKSWNDPRIQAENRRLRLPALGITPVHRADGSGTTYIYTHYLSAVSDEWKFKVGAGKSVNWPAGVAASGNAGVAGAVSHDKGGIGYVELAYAVQSRLNYGPIRNKSGNYVLASVASTTAAANSAAGSLRENVRTPIANGAGTNAYPIAGFTYLLVPKSPRDGAKGRAIADFLRWAMGPGQAMAPDLYYAPLPRSVVAINAKSVAHLSGARR